MHGIPLVVVSDNGPCYNSKEFQDFAAHYDFRHITSSPHHAQSNGKAGKGVHIVKQLLKKASEGKSDPYLALLSYRATPLEHESQYSEEQLRLMEEQEAAACRGRGAQTGSSRGGLMVLVLLLGATDTARVRLL
ncbi:protein NYNRIN-like [Pimephales promelas]|nr:protein NYNRIN-like [Pimephales promelas]